MINSPDIFRSSTILKICNTPAEKYWRDRKGYDRQLSIAEYYDRDDRLFSVSSIAGQWDFLTTPT
jgi:hypothetical protein